MKKHLLWLADRTSHKTCDWYINAKPFDHHLPGWGRLQLWQWHLCNAFVKSQER